MHVRGRKERWHLCHTSCCTTTNLPSCLMLGKHQMQRSACPCPSFGRVLNFITEGPLDTRRHESALDARGTNKSPSLLCRHLLRPPHFTHHTSAPIHSLCVLFPFFFGRGFRSIRSKVCWRWRMARVTIYCGCQESYRGSI